MWRGAASAPARPELAPGHAGRSRDLIAEEEPIGGAQTDRAALRQAIDLGVAEYGRCLATLGDPLAAEDAVHLAVRDVAGALAGGAIAAATPEELRRACARRCRRPGRGLPWDLFEAPGRPGAGRSGAPSWSGAPVGASGLAGAPPMPSPEAAAALADRIEAGLLRHPPRPTRPLPQLRSPTGLAAALAAVLLALTLAGGLAPAGAPGGPLVPLVEANLPAPETTHREPLPARGAVSCAGAGLGLPPAGVALIWVALPCDPEAVLGFDWQGRARGRLPVAALESRAPLAGPLSVDPNDGSLGAGQAALVQSPDGRHLLIGSTLEDTAGADRLTLPGDPLRPSAVWADDSRHLCGLRNDAVFDGGRATYVYLAQPGQPAGTVANLLGIGPPSTTPASDILACSPGAERLLLQRRGPEGVTAIRLFDLATARPILTRPHSGDQVAYAVASHDGGLIAENSGGPNVQGPLRAAAVISLPDEHELRAFPGVDIRAFSWDGTLVVTSKVGIPDETQVVDRRSGAVVWSSGGGRLLEQALAQPGGGALALAVAPAIPPIVPGCANPCRLPVLPEIVIVHPDGGFQRLAAAAAPAW